MTKKERLIEEYESLLFDVDHNPNMDTEDSHAEADRLLCKLLVELGYEDVVAAYQLIGKWYA